MSERWISGRSLRMFSWKPQIIFRSCVRLNLQHLVGWYNARSWYCLPHFVSSHAGTAKDAFEDLSAFECKAVRDRWFFNGELITMTLFWERQALGHGSERATRSYITISRIYCTADLCGNHAQTWLILLSHCLKLTILQYIYHTAHKNISVCLRKSFEG